MREPRSSARLDWQVRMVMQEQHSWGKMDWKERKDWKVTRDCLGTQGSEARQVKWVPHSSGRQDSRETRARRDSGGLGVRRAMRAQRSQEQLD